MEPKEKAKELYLKYTDALNIRDLVTTANPFAKQCALIAVDEIIVNIKDAFEHCWNHLNWGGEYDIIDYEIYISYWQQVKQEIETI